MQLGELLVRRADERFAESQRSGTRHDGAPGLPRGVARYQELLKAYPNFERRDAVAYTLGTLYSQDQRHSDAVKAFSTVARDSSAFTSEALFRLGDSYFEIASTQRGAARRASFARAASAYERAAASAPKDGDIYFLSLYKLGWSYYNQATQTSQGDYSKAVDVFGRLIDAYDKLSPQQQARLGLRSETIEYMAVAFTQVGGAEAANRYFAAHGGTDYRLPVMRRVAFNLQEQGDFATAADAYEAVITQAPNDSNAIGLQREIIDIYQNRMLEPERAQQARLDLVTGSARGRNGRRQTRTTQLRSTAQPSFERSRSDEAAQYASRRRSAGATSRSTRPRRRCTSGTCVSSRSRTARRR